MYWVSKFCIVLCCIVHSKSEGVPLDQVANTDSASVIATVPSDLNVTIPHLPDQQPVANGYIPNTKDTTSPPPTPLETSVSKSDKSKY